MTALLQELQLTSLFSTIWFMEALFQYIHASPVISQLLVGICYGPSVFDFIPFVGALRVLGKLGVFLVVLESGLSVDFHTVRSMGGRAALGALAGVIVPVVMTLIVLKGGWGTSWTTALAAGAALAPTSLGFSAQLLTEMNQRETASGQFICTAAVMDDVLSLLLLSEIQALQSSGTTTWEIVRPLLASIGSIVVGLGLTICMVPKLAALPRYVPKGRLETVYMFSIFFIATLFSWLSAWVGSSDLLGCFFAGLIFSTEPRVFPIWQKHTHQLVRWGGALFFAATIGFGVPKLSQSGGLFEVNAVARGAALTAVAILGKFTVGFFFSPFSYSNIMKIGWAMGGRGEFSFLIAEEASRDDLLNDTNYSAIIWALLLSSFAAPFGFRHFLKQEKETDDIEMSETNSAALRSSTISESDVQVACWRSLKETAIIVLMYLWNSVMRKGDAPIAPLTISEKQRLKIIGLQDCETYRYVSIEDPLGSDLQVLRRSEAAELQENVDAMQSPPADAERAPEGLPPLDTQAARMYNVSPAPSPMSNLMNNFQSMNTSFPDVDEGAVRENNMEAGSETPMSDAALSSETLWDQVGNTASSMVSFWDDDEVVAEEEPGEEMSVDHTWTRQPRCHRLHGQWKNGTCDCPSPDTLLYGTFSRV